MYGNPLVNTNFTNSHLWGSTYLTAGGSTNLLLSDAGKLSTGSSLHSNPCKNLLSSLNQFEGSSLFLLKRFYHINFSKLDVLAQSQKLNFTKQPTNIRYFYYYCLNSYLRQPPVAAGW